jgi:DNA-binding NtrC family response regulator
LHPWPLNVRGLLNVLSIAALASPADTPLGLYPEVTAALDAAEALAAPASEPAVEKPTSMPSIEALEAALEQAEGSVADAARRLGATRQQLYRWIEARGISLARFRAPRG